jgi:pyridoxal/pyridoxine/pyridoxamine kinase
MDIFSLVTTVGRTDPSLVLTVHIERSALQLICVSGEVEEMWKCSRYIVKVLRSGTGDF